MKINVTAALFVLHQAGPWTLTIACWHCYNEIETLSHVLGSCPLGETVRNARHHKIRSSIAKALRDSGFKVYKEVYGLSTCGISRRIDMIAFNKKMEYIIDPTVRFETSKNQPEDVA